MGRILVFPVRQTSFQTFLFRDGPLTLLFTGPGFPLDLFPTMCYYKAMLNVLPKEEIGRVKPDAKGRITLGKMATDVSSFIVFRQPDGNLLLEPLTEIPAREKWLFNNSEALASVKQGLVEAAKGEVISRGSFKKFTDNEI